MAIAENSEEREHRNNLRYRERRDLGPKDCWNVTTMTAMAGKTKAAILERS